MSVTMKIQKLLNKTKQIQKVSFKKLHHGYNVRAYLILPRCILKRFIKVFYNNEQHNKNVV